MRISKIVKTIALKYPEIRHHLNFTSTTSDGKYKIPIIAGLGSGNIDEREDYVGYVIGKILQQNEGAFLDVGANVGQTFLHFLRSGTGSKYVGFDVQVWCVAYVQKLIEVNGVPNAYVYPYGLSNKNSMVTIFSKGIADSAASIDKKFRDPSFYQKETHGATRLGDQAVEEIGLDNIALIKIDVEGCEADVIEGLETTLRKSKPYIISEILPTGHVKDSEIVSHRIKNMKRFENTIKGLGFLTYRINPDCTISRVENLDNNEFDLRYCNFLFSPRELHEGFPW